jgi:hypothetical protein
VTPIVLDRVPDVVERVRREIVLARFVGKLAVDQGVREVRGRVESLLTPPSEEPPPAPAPVAPPSVATDASDSGPSSDSLALDDYDQLPAAHIVAKLHGLRVDERDAIEAYERANRHRRTVLTKLEQLRSDPT